MKLIQLLFLFFAMSGLSAQTFTPAGDKADQTTSIQRALNDPAVRTILIDKNDVVINGVLQIPDGKTLRFENGFVLRGHGTINGGHIEAADDFQLFDTSLTVNPKSVNGHFSVKWFGAKGNADGDQSAIQHAIDVCIRNNIRTLFFPAGKYLLKAPLIVRGASLDKQGTRRAFCTLELLGESSFWDSNTGSEIVCRFNDAFAIGIQNGKGCKVRKIKITGNFKPPSVKDTKEFFGLPFEEFTDGKSRDSRYSPYAAIVIDPFTNLSSDKVPPDGGYPTLKDWYGKPGGLSSQSGSTGTELEELNIQGFVVGICSSPNGITRNAEITIINKVQFSNCKLCIAGGQDQEKDNIVSNIYCWGGTHTIFATGLYGSPRMAGNWNIRNVNIAGGVVRFIYNDQHGYFPTNISNVFAESLGTFGTLNSQLACQVSDCIFDFAYQSQAGKLLLLEANGANVVFRSCNFRYYGQKTPMLMKANCVFDHCYFSGPVTGDVSSASVTGFKDGVINKPDKVLMILIILLLGMIGFHKYKKMQSLKITRKQPFYDSFPGQNN